MSAVIDPVQAERIRQNLREFSGPEDVMCLHAICQPLATDMQEVIRFQRAQLVRITQHAVKYLLIRISREAALREQIGAGTETFERLTAVYAEATGLDVDAVRDHYIPGSARLHKRGEE